MHVIHHCAANLVEASDTEREAYHNPPCSFPRLGLQAIQAVTRIFTGNIALTTLFANVLPSLDQIGSWQESKLPVF